MAAFDHDIALKGLLLRAEQRTQLASLPPGTDHSPPGTLGPPMLNLTVAVKAGVKEHVEAPDPCDTPHSPVFIPAPQGGPGCPLAQSPVSESFGTFVKRGNSWATM